MEQKFALVVFGITSNLAKKKFIPALYGLFKSGRLNNFRIIGISGRQRNKKEYKELLTDSIRGKDKEFMNKFVFLWGDARESYLFEEIGKKLNALRCENRIFYLAVDSGLYGPILQGLSREKLNNSDCGWTRLMLEKPFGKDLKSAVELNKLVGRFYKQEQLFMVDHFLAKEMVENMLVFRRENNIFEELMKSDLLDHIQVLVAEDFGVEERGTYYEEAGALRDVGQNHLLQMLTYAVMGLDKKKMLEERLAVAKNLRVKKNSLVRGRYEGYKGKAETYFAFEAGFIEGRLKGVPVFFRSGKKLKKRVAEVAMIFKGGNNLIFRIQPDEGIILKTTVKEPGLDGQTGERLMKLCFSRKSDELLDPYQKLLLLAIGGKREWFVFNKEIEVHWRLIDGLKKDKIFSYKQGSWGPKQAERLMEKGRKWLEPDAGYCQL